MQKSIKIKVLSLVLRVGFEPQPMALRSLRATKTTSWRRTTHRETDSHGSSHRQGQPA